MCDIRRQRRCFYFEGKKMGVRKEGERSELGENKP